MFVYFVSQLFGSVKFSLVAFIIFFWVFLTIDLSVMSSTEKLISVDFEIFGRVQGVFFRKYTDQQANQLGLRGWCMNTRQDTVKGVVEGPPQKVNQMKYWLEKTGSPQSRIDRAVFTNEKNITKYTYDSFRIKR